MNTDPHLDTADIQFRPPSTSFLPAPDKLIESAVRGSLNVEVKAASYHSPRLAEVQAQLRKADELIQGAVTSAEEAAANSPEARERDRLADQLQKARLSLSKCHEAVKVAEMKVSDAIRSGRPPEAADAEVRRSRLARLEAEERVGLIERLLAEAEVKAQTVLEAVYQKALEQMASMYTQELADSRDQLADAVLKAAVPVHVAERSLWDVHHRLSRLQRRRVVTSVLAEAEATEPEPEPVDI